MQGATDALRHRGLSRRPADAGVLRLGDQQFRRRGAARGVHRRMRPGRCRARRASALVEPPRSALTGFVFKIQANMDPAHRDRIAFMRLCSGTLRARHAPVSRAARQGGARGRCAHLHGRRSRAGARKPTRATSSACTTTARSTSATPSPQGEQLTLHRHSELRAGALPPRGAQGSAEDEGAAARASRSCARRARRSSSSRCATTI